MGLLDRIFGYRWSLYIVTNGSELRYVVHENSVVRILGYVLGGFVRYGEPEEPWSLHVNFNRSNRSIRLRREHFTPDGEDLSPSLLGLLAEIDPVFDTIRGAEPVVLEAATKKKIKISNHSISSAASVKKFLEDGRPEEPTLFSILDQVFGVESETDDDGE